jgi:hypothetical protein
VDNRFCVAACSSVLVDSTCQCRGFECSGRPANAFWPLTS